MQQCRYYPAGGIEGLYQPFGEDIPNQNQAGYNTDLIYINYNTMDLSFVPATGFEALNDGEVIIGDDGKAMLYSKYAYANDSYTDAQDEYAQSLDKTEYDKFINGTDEATGAIDRLEDLRQSLVDKGVVFVFLS